MFANESANPTANAFVKNGFSTWNKIGGKACSFKSHVGKNPNSRHKRAEESCKDLLNRPQHLEVCVDKVGKKFISRNRLRLRVSILVARYCAFHAIAYSGHDESLGSKNRRNFLELVKLIASFSEGVDATVLENAPHNASYTSPSNPKGDLIYLCK